VIIVSGKFARSAHGVLKAVEKVFAHAKCNPQALKRESIFRKLAARLNVVPFPRSRGRITQVSAQKRARTWGTNLHRLA
jgi:hypothetical protein